MKPERPATPARLAYAVEVGAVLGISTAVLGVRALLARRAANRTTAAPATQVLR